MPVRALLFESFANTVMVAGVLPSAGIAGALVLTVSDATLVVVPLLLLVPLLLPAPLLLVLPLQL